MATYKELRALHDSTLAMIKELLPSAVTNESHIHTLYALLNNVQAQADEAHLVEWKDAHPNADWAYRIALATYETLWKAYTIEDEDAYWLGLPTPEKYGYCPPVW